MANNYTTRGYQQGEGSPLDGFNFRKLAILGGGFLAFLVLFFTSGQLFETNNAGWYQVKQAAYSGTMSVRTEPGTYWQGFGTITSYQISDEYAFDGKLNSTGTDGPILVRFNDGGKANITGVIKFRLSTHPDDQMLLHNDFKSYSSVQHSLIRQVVTEAVQQTANLMKAEESYSARRSEFAALAEEQVINGIYETVANVQKTKDTDGNEFVDTYVSLKMINGKPVVRKTSPLPRYKVEVLQFVIKEIDFDETVENLISKKKEAEQQKVVARANAEKAKQDTITAREQGEAKIAVARADEEVKKVQAVVQAQQAYEVSVLNRKQADEDAKSSLIKQQAIAESNRLLVKAGLTPLERANIDKETAIGVAKALSGIQLPTTFITGGGANGGRAADPFTAIGLNQMMELTERMAKTRGPRTAPAKQDDQE